MKQTSFVEKIANECFWKFRRRETVNKNKSILIQ